MIKKIKKLLFISSLALLVSLVAKEVTVGYQGIFNPWKHAIATGEFERVTGYEINWRKFDSGAAVINAMASKDLQIAVAGSSPIAAGVSRGIDMQLFWILEDINAAEALVVRNGSGISEPNDLIGKKIAVPFGSTTHFHMLFALEVWKINPKKVKILNVQPNPMIALWAKKEIDGAFVWDPALGKLKKNGRVLITSGELSAKGKATFDGMVVDRKWGKANKNFMKQFVQILAKADASYRDNPSSWTPNSPQVASIIKLVGGNKKDVPGVLALYSFPTLKEQASRKWLGGKKNSGAVKALLETSKFLKSQKKVPGIQRSYTKFVNDAYVKAALR